MSVIRSVLRSEKEHHAGVLIFPTEALQFEVLSFLRAQKITLNENLQVMPIMFQNSKSRPSREVVENIIFGIVFGKFIFINPPFKMLYADKKQLLDVIGHIAAPATSVAIVTDEGLPIIQVHTSRLQHKVSYFGFKKDLDNFRKTLGKERVVFEKQSDDSDDHEEASVRSDVIAEDKSNESSTSPFKKNEQSDSSKCLDDSGIDNDPGAGTSSIKKNFNYDVYKFSDTIV